MRPKLRLVCTNAPPFVQTCRLVPLTAELLAIAMAASGDGALVEHAQRPEVLRQVLAPGLSFAVLDGGILAVAYGIFPVVYGRAHGWMTRTPLATRRHLAYAVRQAADHLAIWNAQEPYRRIEIQIQDGQPWRESFAKRLGMNECLGPARKWDHLGRDYWLYARIAP